MIQHWSPRRLLAYAAIYVLWGGSFLAIRVLVAEMPPFFAAAFRFFLAGLALTAFARLTGGERVSARAWRDSALLGLLMFAGNYACLFWAEQRLTSGLAAVLDAMIPIWVLLGECLVLRAQRCSAVVLAGVGLGFAGVVLLAGVGPAAAHTGQRRAALILILGTILWSAGTLWSRFLTLPRRQTTRAGLQMMTGGLFLFVFSAGAGEFRALPTAARAWDWRTAAAMLYLIIAASIIAFTCYTWLIAREPATRVASYAYVNPLFALLIGALLAQERMTPLQWAGAALVIFGVFATLTAKHTAPVEMLPEEALRET